MKLITLSRIANFQSYFALAGVKIIFVYEGMNESPYFYRTLKMDNNMLD